MRQLLIYLAGVLSFAWVSLDTSEVAQALSKQDYKSSFAHLLASLDVGSAVALAALAAYAYYQARKDDEWIPIVLRYPNGEEERIESAFQRGECLRGEVSGVLGTFGQFSIAYLKEDNGALLRENIKRVRNGEVDELIIPIAPTDAFVGLTGERKKLRREDPRPHAFVNLSNHSAEGWSEAQKRAAHELSGGEHIVDVPFPNVNPEQSTEALQEEAKALIKELEQQLKEGEHHLTAAMVAGEPLMCALLIEGLTNLGVRCYSATTARVSEMVEGEKRSRFEFVRFRAWPERVKLG